MTVGSVQRRVGFSLSRKFALAFLGLVAFALLLNGVISMWFAYEEATEAAVRVEQEKAAAAAERVVGFVSEIEQQMGWTTRIEWSRVPVEQRRYDFIRLLRQAPAITEIVHVDGSGREQIRLSRLEPDMIGSGTDYKNDPRFLGAITNRIWYGPVTFRRGSEPYMSLAMAHAGREPGATIAEVNLKLIWDVISAIRVGDGGYAYVTDRNGRLIAHPDMSLVLRDTNLAALPQVIRATSASSGFVAPQLGNSVGPDGKSVLSANATIPKLGWIVFVELPTREALAPVYTALYQTLGLLAFGIVLAGAAGLWVARRMVEPIRVLQMGADRLGAGDLSQRISIQTGDEIEVLADRFNAMSDRIQQSYETLEARVADRTEKLSQSLDDLREAQDRLVQTEKLASLGQLTAGIAHEIKNPLNFVTNFAEMSRELVAEIEDGLKGELDARTRADIVEAGALLRGNLEKIATHGKRADSIVKNMLAHSRDGGGESRRVDLNAAIEEAIALAYHGARAEKPGFNVKLVKDYDPAVGPVEIYPQEFNRVLINLASNGFYAAAKRKAEGGENGFEPELRVATKLRGGYVEITVRDNGTGIPDAVRARLFEPFFTTKPPGEGTGLGLSISHDIIVKQHKGRIDVSSVPGQFTEFSIFLPRSSAKSGDAS